MTTGAAPIRVLLVDDHRAFLQPLAFLFGQEPDVTVVGQAESLAEARPLLAAADVVLVDLGLPDGDGAELIRALRAANPRARALVLTGSTASAEAARAVAAGAAGVLDKARPVAELVLAVRRVGRGEALLTPAEGIALQRLGAGQRAQDRAARATIGQLTPREGEVLRALADGLSDREIGTRLQVGKGTVTTHMVHLLAKLGVDSRLQALVTGVRHGLVTVRAEGPAGGG